MEEEISNNGDFLLEKSGILKEGFEADLICRVKATLKRSPLFNLFYDCNEIISGCFTNLL